MMRQLALSSKISRKKCSFNAVAEKLICEMPFKNPSAAEKKMAAMENNHVNPYAWRPCCSQSDLPSL
jgi:hypothetical protein